MVLVAASYCQVNLQHQECQGDMILQWDGKLTLKTPLSILNYICEKSPNLLGKNKAQILQWVMYSLGMNKTLLYSYFSRKFLSTKFCIFIGDAMSSSLAWVLHKKDKKAKDMLNKMETYLSTRTFLSGERLTLANISLAMVYLPLYQYVMNANLRSKYPNNTRWFNTCIHQSNFLKVLGNVKLCGDK